MGIVKNIKDRIVGAPAEAPAAAFSGGAGSGTQEPLQERTVIEAETLKESQPENAPAPEGGVRIKASPQAMGDACMFMLDKPLLSGYSWTFSSAEESEGSPLADSIFSLEEVESFQVYDATLTVSRRYAPDSDWQELATKVGQRIREHLQSGQPAILEEIFSKIPDEASIRSEAQAVIDEEINPALAGHEGVVTLEKVQGNTVTLSLGGGCQGCGGAAQTLKFGIERALRDRIPYLGLVMDETDHAAGENPYFS